MLIHNTVNISWHVGIEKRDMDMGTHTVVDTNLRYTYTTAADSLYLADESEPGERNDDEYFKFGLITTKRSTINEEESPAKDLWREAISEECLGMVNLKDVDTSSTSMGQIQAD
eukprot:CFRG4659T1